MGRFVHSVMKGETIPFALRIDKFSQVVRRGYYEGPEFRGERSDSKWSLTVYASEGVEYEDFIDIRLQRNESDGKDQSVELKMTIDDYFGLGSLSEKGQFSFTGSRNIHQVMSVPKMSEFRKLRFIPNDTLTIRGEMTVYKELKIPFESEEDFERSLESSNSAHCALVRWILWKLLICLAAAGGVWAILKAVIYAVHNILVPFLHDVVFPFVVSVLMIVAFFYWLSHEAKKILKRKERHYSRKPNGYSGRELELVPFANGGYEQTANYYSGGKNYGKPMKHGGYGQKVIYVIDAGHYFGRNNRYLCE